VKVDVLASAGLGVRTQGTVGRVKTLHTAYRVTDLAASLDFYTALGYGEVGRVDIGDGASLTMLKFSGEEVVTLELVHRSAGEPVDIGTGFSHLVVQVDNLAAAIETLSRAGLRPGRSFAAYWFLIRASSGAIRCEVLSVVARRAESRRMPKETQR
jgi:hypothetical protein